ncbi:hypothetical protein [Methanomassiliicoccus luminyensis]|uniref:hypothetical protein n=1 Tax=Methanomassiliicoccus luminyensis TaxID=1080712 RepID=UPI0011C97666|nr:hypothetical protein [Methanomassiliicoccus luminyensis]
MRTVCFVDESILGARKEEGALGLRRFVRMLQDLLDEEGLPIDVRIGVAPGNRKIAQGLKGLKDHVPEWILSEARQLFQEELPG